jgi:hypothetical protein
VDKRIKVKVIYFQVSVLSASEGGTKVWHTMPCVVGNTKVIKSNANSVLLLTYALANVQEISVERRLSK